MRFDADTRDFLDQIAARGPAQPEATLGEAWSASWSSAGLSTIGGVAAPRTQALDELASAYRTASGVDPYEEARRQGVPLDVANDDQKAATIAMLARGLPDAAQQQLAPHLDVNAKAASIAAKIDRTASETADRTWGLSANGAMVLAGLARTMVDPATLAVTAGVAAATPETGGLAAFLAREAFVNAGTTAATQPFVNADRERLGLQNAPLLESIGESAVAGAALGGLFRGAGAVARRIFWRNAVRADAPIENNGLGSQTGDISGSAVQTPDMPPAARDAAGAVEPEDFTLAARHLDNRDVEDMQAPRADAGGVMAHAQAIDAATAAIDAARPVDEFIQSEPGRPDLLDVTGIKNVRRPGGERGGPATKSFKSAASIPEWFGNVEATLNELSASLGLETRPKLWVGTPMREDWRTGGTSFSHGHIVINDNLTEHAALHTAIHELGHQVEVQKFRKLSADEQRAIRDAWTRDAYRGGKGKTVVQHRPLTAQRYGPLNQGAKADAYVRSFEEWFAEQVSRFITTKKEPIGIVERFFAGIAEMWRALYERVVGHVPLSKEVDAFMRKTWRGNLDEAIARQIIAAGRPEEEARAAGALIAARYETRAARFKGALGSAKDLYAREAPNIVGVATGPEIAIGDRVFRQGGIEDFAAFLKDAVAKGEALRPENTSIRADSQYVDQTAKEWTLYHGSGAPIDFKKFTIDHGFNPHTSGDETGVLWFTPKASEAANYAGEMVDGVAVGPRIFKVRIKPGKTEVFDLAKLVMSDDFRKAVRETAERRAADLGADINARRRENYIESVMRSFDREREMVALFDATDREGLEVAGFSFHAGETVIRVAKERGLDTAILRGMKESRGGDQVIVLTKNRVRNAISPRQILFQDGRGQIAFRDGGKPILSLLRDADASTFIHESGHDFLEQLMRDAAHAQAPDDLKADAQTVLKWFGVDSADKITTENHEAFARAFEQYMRDGQAPNAGLRKIFDQFRKWLTAVYRVATDLGAPISEDIRGVFDRMLALDSKAEPPRPLSDYPLREVATPVKQEGAPSSSEGKSSTPVSLQKSANLKTAAPELAALRASAERAIAEAGDEPFHFTDEATGETRLIAPSALLREIDEDAVAARELEACVAGIELRGVAE
jgi:hypothetical protein